MKRIFAVLAALAVIAAREWEECETCRLSVIGTKLFIDIDEKSSVQEISDATCHRLRRIGAKKSAHLCEEIIQKILGNEELMKKIKDNREAGWEKRFCAKELQKKYCKR
ncbi:hypothetical protein Y032_0101g3400 [Ancylostoma ceylanicum]|uniref:Saposin B-type domain-containing protein n=1 Tax=Ancylostoma ceylanicum TaxID=53326 RepID=A0A016TH19_9BILA|nr:hypothetical protein Y032_0101g3400 [Ancylostoma ceylanicum]